MDKYKWGMVEVLPDGHRLFYGVEDDSKSFVAIADNSGREPQDTEDGVLYLNFNHSLAIRHHRGEESCSIPLRNEDGETTRTLTNAATLLVLSAEFDWPIADPIGITFNVKEEKS